jgi:hypothetical protein
MQRLFELFKAFHYVHLKMPDIQQMNGLRRNEDQSGANAGIKII